MAHDFAHQVTELQVWAKLLNRFHLTRQASYGGYAVTPSGAFRAVMASRQLDSTAATLSTVLRLAAPKRKPHQKRTRSGRQEKEWPALFAQNLNDNLSKTRA